jgi:hypothetical protein
VVLGFLLCGPNLGLPIGYYGKLKTMRREIERRPGLTIVRVAMHRDWSLEDFWITVRRPDGSKIELAFVNANIRSRADLRRELERLGGP